MYAINRLIITETATFAGNRLPVVFLILNSLDQCKISYDYAYINTCKSKNFIKRHQILFYQ
jgi:hypothetical protein